MVDVPPVVGNKAHAVGAVQWLDELPALVAGLERDWGITVGRPYRDATEAFVAEATLDDGVPVVLKLLVPSAGDAASNEITVLRLTDGDGWVGLVRDDPARGALLLERLGRSMHELALPVGRRLEILCSIAARVWRSGRRGRVRPGRAHARGPLELLHGDPHERARWLAARSGLVATAIWEWGCVERVSTGLLCTKVGLQPVRARCWQSPTRWRSSACRLRTTTGAAKGRAKLSSSAA